MSMSGVMPTEVPVQSCARAPAASSAVATKAERIRLEWHTSIPPGTNLRRKTLAGKIGRSALARRRSRRRARSRVVAIARPRAPWRAEPRAERSRRVLPVELADRAGGARAWISASGRPLATGVSALRADEAGVEEADEGRSSAIARDDLRKEARGRDDVARQRAAEIPLLAAQEVGGGVLGRV